MLFQTRKSFLNGYCVYLVPLSLILNEIPLLQRYSTGHDTELKLHMDASGSHTSQAVVNYACEFLSEDIYQQAFLIACPPQILFNLHFTVLQKISPMRVMMTTIFKPQQCFLLQLQILASALTFHSGPDGTVEATDSGVKKNFLASERHQLGYRGQQLLERNEIKD